MNSGSSFLRQASIALLGGLGVCIAPGARAQTTQTRPADILKPAPLSSAGAPPAAHAAALPLPIVRVTLSRPLYYIAIDPKTGAPQMPRDVTVSAEVQNWPAEVPRPQAFVWQVALDWDYAPYPTHHDIARKAFVHPSPFTVDFGKQIRGGTLTITAKTPFSPSGRDLIGQATAMVRGINPTHQAIVSAFPRTRFGLIASKVAMAESSMCQFTPPRGPDPGGLPEMSRTNDLGIMQLNAPTGSITSQDQVWDWRENVRRGIEELAGKQHTAQLVSRAAASANQLPSQSAAHLSLLNFCRQFIGLPALPAPAMSPLSTVAGSGALPGDPDIDHLALSQLERDAIRRYNGGREYAYGIVTDPFTPTIRYAGWLVDPSRGGLRDRSGDLDYVRHVLRAHSGLTLPPPPKPAKKTGKTASKRARHGRHRKH